MIKRYDYIIFILDIDEAKTQVQVQVNIEMMHTQTIMQMLVSFFLVTFHSGHPKIIGLILSLSLSVYIYIYICVRVCVSVNLEKQIYIPSHVGYIKTGVHAVRLKYNNVHYYLN